MLKKTLFVLLSALILSGVCFAQEDPAKKQMEETTPAAAPQQPALVLEEIHMCTAVEDRQPSGVGTVFPDDLDKLYCFTKISGAEDPTFVYHVWYFGNNEIARVKLPVNAKSWRTWSSKKLYMLLGNGHVEIVSESGALLGKAEFEIKTAEKAEAVEKTEATGITEEGKEVEKTEKTVVPEKPLGAPKQQ
jgi:hypothetical protein